MEINTLRATASGQLPKAKRHNVPIRLLEEAHLELRETAKKEQRSMGFIALRRYRKGLEIELAENC